MKKFFLVILATAAFGVAGCAPKAVISPMSKADSDLPLDACIFLGNYDPRSAGYVMGTREHFLNAPRPFFRSVKEISSMENTEDCDIAVRISCGSSCWSVTADVFSARTKKALMRVNQAGPSAGKNIAASVLAAFQEDTSLGQAILAEQRTLGPARKPTLGESKIPEASAAEERKSEGAVPPNRPKIAVWDLAAREIKESYGQELTSILVSEISKLGKYEVYSQENVRTLAGWTGERMKLGCSDTQCLTALGQMDIAKLISGSLGKIGNRYSVSLNLFDTQNSKSEKAVSEFGRSEDELIDLVQIAVRKLLGAENLPAGVQGQLPAQDPSAEKFIGEMLREQQPKSPPPQASPKPNISR